HRVFPPVVTGAVVMLIGFGLAYVVADVYWPQDPWIALITMIATFLIIVLFRGFVGRIGVLLGLIVGYVLSWIADKVFGDITAYNAATSQVDTHPRVSFQGVAEAAWIGLPDFHAPSLQVSAIVLVLPAVIALVAENVGHVKA